MESDLHLVDISNGFLRFYKYEENAKGKYFYYKLDGTKLVNKAYSSLSAFFEGMAVFIETGERNEIGKTGFINTDGNIIYMDDYLLISPFLNGYAVVYNHDGYNFINKSFNPLLKKSLDVKYITPFFHGVSVFYDRKNGKGSFGVVYTDGSIVFIKKDKEIRTSFIDGVAIIKENKTGKFSLIDTNLNEITGFKYELLTGSSLILQDPLCSYDFCDIVGTYFESVYYSSKHSQYTTKSEDIYFAKYDNKSFYINSKGECVKDCQNAPENHPRVKQ